MEVFLFFIIVVNAVPKLNLLYIVSWFYTLIEEVVAILRFLWALRLLVFVAILAIGDYSELIGPLSRYYEAPVFRIVVVGKGNIGEISIIFGVGF
jgi:hypothetical protein